LRPRERASAVRQRALSRFRDPRGDPNGASGASGDVGQEVQKPER
jgi:hypothetical protein